MSRSWEPNSSAASQEIPPVLCNSKVHCRVNERLPLTAILSQMNESCPRPPVLFFTVLFNVILPSTPWSSKRRVLQFSHQQPACILLSSTRATCPPHSHPPLFGHRNNSRHTVHIVLLLIVKFCSADCVLTWLVGVKVLDYRVQVIITTVLSRKLKLLLCVIVISSITKVLHRDLEWIPPRGVACMKLRRVIQWSYFFCHSCSELWQKETFFL